MRGTFGREVSPSLLRPRAAEQLLQMRQALTQPIEGSFLAQDDLVQRIDRMLQEAQLGLELDPDRVGPFGRFCHGVQPNRKHEGLSPRAAAWVPKFRPMNPLALVLLVAQAGLPETDLRAGEVLTWLPEGEAVVADLVRGQVVDAATGLSVPGARVELWTEENDAAAGGLQLIGAATTDGEGTFLFSARRGDSVGSKLLVHHEGYLTYPGTLSDADLIRLVPRCVRPGRLRVLDMTGRPVMGARITSTYSCAHDAPALDLTTNATGEVTLPTYGPQPHAGDLRIQAPGFAGLEYVSLQELPGLHGPDTAQVWLTRSTPAAGRALDARGRPLGEQVLWVVDAEGHHVPRTDSRGVFRIESPYAPGELTVSLLETSARHLYSGRMPRERPVALRLDGDRWPDSVPLAEFRFEPPLPEGAELQVFHSEGWFSREVGSFPAGSAMLLVGGAFSGWEEQLLEVELEPGRATVLEVELQAEPRLHVHLPDEPHGRLRVQVGDRSSQFDGRGEASFFVPAGGEVGVLWEGSSLRRLQLPPLRGDTTADLRPEACVLQSSRVSSQRYEVLVEVPRLAEGSLNAVGPGDPLVERLGPETFRASSNRSYGMRLEYRAPELCPSTRVVVPGEGRVKMAPVSQTRLEILFPDGTAFPVEGYSQTDLGSLDPGRRTFTLLGPTRRARLTLNLSPGEERRIVIRP